MYHEWEVISQDERSGTQELGCIYCSKLVCIDIDDSFPDGVCDEQ